MTVVTLIPKQVLEQAIAKLRWSAERSEDGSVLLTPQESKALLDLVEERRWPRR